MSMQAEIEVGSTWLTNRETQNVMVVARLGPGVTRAQGEARIRAPASHNSSASIPQRSGLLSRG